MLSGARIQVRVIIKRTEEMKLFFLLERRTSCGSFNFLRRKTLLLIVRRLQFLDACLELHFFRKKIEEKNDFFFTYFINK